MHSGVPVVTIELPNATRTPRDAEIRQMWLDLLGWMSARLRIQRQAKAVGPSYFESRLVPAAPTAE